MIRSKRSPMSRSPRVFRWLETASPATFSAWCVIAAFGTYFCTYAFRKPFTAGTFETVSVAGFSFKTILVAAEVSGYALSKFLGIKFVSETPASRRVVGILVLIGLAEAALLLFAITPPPYNCLMLFLNGLSLGMVFGLVLAFLEGRRLTEALAAGLCASFILASGVVRSVGRALIEYAHVSEYWMPFLTGLIFLPPLLCFTWMLSQIPPPSHEDVVHRTQRKPMSRQDRREFFRRHRWGLIGLLSIFVLLTLVRSIRDDFAVELWRDLGESGKPLIFAQSEMLVMLGVVLVNGLAITIRNNQHALLASLSSIIFGMVTALASLFLFQQGRISGYMFMVLIGVGTYIPYVAFHTTVFERLIASVGEAANIGYLIYLADAAGYLCYAGVMLAKSRMTDDVEMLPMFVTTSVLISLLSIVIALCLMLHYRSQMRFQVIANDAGHEESL